LPSSTPDGKPRKRFSNNLLPGGNGVPLAEMAATVRREPGVCGCTLYALQAAVGKPPWNVSERDDQEAHKKSDFGGLLPSRAGPETGGVTTENQPVFMGLKSFPVAERHGASKK